MKITKLPPEPKLYDAVVTACWADMVAEGHATEGQTFNNGNEFRVFSTLQGAIDSGAQNIVVAPGEYTERRWWEFWKR